MKLHRIFQIPREINNTFQHAIGLEFFPVFKTMMDIHIPLGLGISFNLNTISENPSEINNYVPSFFIELDPLVLFFSGTISY